MKMHKSRNVFLSLMGEIKVNSAALGNTEDFVLLQIIRTDIAVHYG